MITPTRVFFSYSSAVLLPDQGHLFAIAAQIKQLDTLLKAVHTSIEAKHGSIEYGDYVDRNSTWSLATSYTPKPCRHIAKLPKPAEGCQTEIGDVYVDVVGQPSCILCGEELDWCPRCCNANLSRQTYPRHTIWRDLSAEVVALAGDFNILEDRVLVVRECRACGFVEIGSTNDPEAYML